jgi:hypothetical protein
MFKKTLLVAFLFTMITECTMAEVTKKLSEPDELSPIALCDEQYNECAEKCEDSLPNKCLEQCKAIADQCYATVISENEDENENEDDIESVQSDEK